MVKVDNYVLYYVYEAWILINLMCQVYDLKYQKVRWESDYDKTTKNVVNREWNE